MKFLLYMAAFLFPGSHTTLSENENTVDLLLIARKSLPEVIKVLGPVTKIEEFHSRDSECHCQRHYFLNDKLGIVFINNQADWIIAYKPLEMINMEKTKVMFWGKDKDYITLKLTSMKQDACCLPL
jgi:hypothetical protein